jgi:hypothetical protein
MANDNSDTDSSLDPTTSTYYDLCLSEFFELPLSELDSVKYEDTDGLFRNRIKITLTDTNMQSLINELEPDKKELGNDYISRRNFLELFLEKVHLKSVFDIFDPEYNSIRISWSESISISDLNTNDLLIDGSLIRFYIIISLPDSDYYDYIFPAENGTVSLTTLEVLLRSLYVINTYGNKNYYKVAKESFPALANPHGKYIVKGDLDENETIDITDLSLLSLALIGDKTLSDAQALTADIDGDGNVTLADLARLQQYLSKKIESL